MATSPPPPQRMVEQCDTSPHESERLITDCFVFPVRGRSYVSGDFVSSHPEAFMSPHIMRTTETTAPAGRLASPPQKNRRVSHQRMLMFPHSSPASSQLGLRYSQLFWKDLEELTVVWRPLPGPSAASPPPPPPWCSTRCGWEPLTSGPGPPRSQSEATH